MHKNKPVPAQVGAPLKFQKSFGSVRDKTEEHVDLFWLLQVYRKKWRKTMTIVDSCLKKAPTKKAQVTASDSPPMERMKKSLTRLPYNS